MIVAGVGLVIHVAQILTRGSRVAVDFVAFKQLNLPNTVVFGSHENDYVGGDGGRLGVGNDGFYSRSSINGSRTSLSTVY